MSRLPGAGRSVTSRPAGTGVHLATGLPGYRDEPPGGMQHQGLPVPVITWGRCRQGGPCRLVLATGSLVLESAGQAGGCRGGTLA